MGCGTSTTKQPRRSCHPLVGETTTLSLRVKAADAIKNNDAFLVEKILQEISATENLGMSGENSTCLHFAAHHNSFQAMRTLITWLRNNKPNEMEQILEVANSEGNTPAMICIINNASETFYVMISENAVRRDFTTRTGRTLSELCQCYSLNCLAMLEGKKPDNTPGQNGNISQKEEQSEKKEQEIQKQPVKPEKEVENVAVKEQKVQKEEQPEKKTQEVQKQPVKVEQELIEKKIENAEIKAQKVQKEEQPEKKTQEVQKQPVKPEQELAEKEVENVAVKEQKVQKEEQPEKKAQEVQKQPVKPEQELAEKEVENVVISGKVGKKEEQADQKAQEDQKQPVKPDQELIEKQVENIATKVQKVQKETDEELHQLKIAKNPAIPSILEGVPTKSKVYSILSDLIKKDTYFQDPDFPAQLSSITNTKNNQYQDHFQNAKWKRPNELFSCEFDDNIFVFDNIEANDIAQGILGVCYFLASLSALTEFPSRLTKMFFNKTASKYGAYGIQFYIRGVPTEVVVDDSIPCYGDRKSIQPLFSKPKGKELWVLLVEKAWAKVCKNYVNCEAGLMDEALEYMLGVPSILYKSKEQSAEEIFKTLLEGDVAKHILCASTGTGIEEGHGLVANHAYTIMSVHHVGKHKLVKLRNPWGRFEWNGDFSDKSSLWTDELKAKVGYANADDGVFCMPINDFKKYFDFYTVTIYNDGWEYSYCEAESSVRHAEYFKFTIKETCDAYFRIHQKNKRLYSEEEQKTFKYSSGDLMIARVEEDGTYKPIVENKEDIDASSVWGARSIIPSKHLKLNLKPGEYIIRTKMRWRTSQKDQFTVSAYAPTKLEIKHVKPIKDFLSLFYKNMGKSATKQKLAEGCETSKGHYGNNFYLYFENSTEKTWKLDYKFPKLENMRLRKPYNTSENALHVEVPPGKSVVIYLKKIDSTKGTSYSSSYSHRLE